MKYYLIDVAMNPTQNANVPQKTKILVKETDLQDYVSRTGVSIRLEIVEVWEPPTSKELKEAKVKLRDAEAPIPLSRFTEDNS